MKQAFMRGLMAVLLVGSVLLTGCFDYSEVEQVTTQENVEAQTEAAENDADDDSSAENVEIEDIAAPEDDSSDEEDPASQGEENGNSRTNPAGLNEAYTVYKDDWISGKVDLEVEMVEIVSGEEAWEMVREGNQFNDEPDEGMEYVLAKFRFKILETEEDEPYSLWLSTSFDVISEEGVEYTEFVTVAGLEPSLDNDLYAGAEHTGWAAFMINEGDNAVVAVDRRTNAEIWFDLRAGD